MKRQPQGCTTDQGENLKPGAVRSALVTVSVLLIAATGMTPAEAAAPNTGPALRAQGVECPNTSIRSAQSAEGLPDCRAYELVSPVDKSGYDVLATGRAVGWSTRASRDGDAAVFSSIGAFGDAPQANPVLSYLSSRGDHGWSTTSLLPPAYDRTSLFAIGVRGLSEDLSAATVTAGDPPLAAGAPEGVASLYKRESATGAFRLLTPSSATPSEVPFNYQPKFVDGTTNFSSVLLESRIPLTPNTPPGIESDVYLATEAGLELVAVRPDGSPAPEGGFGGIGEYGGRAGGALQEENYTSNAMSEDGSRIYWTDRQNGQIYLRVGAGTPSAESVLVSSPQPASTEPPAGTLPATLLGASASGRWAYFISEERLTPDSLAEPGSPDLYRYDAASRELTDVTGGAGATGPAQVIGFIGASEDGDRIYLVANGALDGAAVPGQPNVYLWEGGAIRYVTTLGEFFTAQTDERNWSPNPAQSSGPRASRVAEDGRFLLLTSALPLTGYDNAGLDQLYVYDAAAQSLECASCDFSQPVAQNAAATWHSGLVAPLLSPFQTRTMSESGERVLFDTAEALVPADTNGLPDVYVWSGGEVALLSSGRGKWGSYLADASRSGNDVFFVTRDRLTWEDRDENADLYDARVYGGFESPEGPPPPCLEAGCRIIPRPPALGVAGSNTYSGPGYHRKRKPRHHATHKRKARAHKKRCQGKNEARQKRCASKGSGNKVGNSVKRKGSK